MAKKSSKSRKTAKKATKKARSARKSAAAGGGKPSAARSMIAAARNLSAPREERVQALANMTDSLCKDSKAFQTVIELLTDTTQPTEVRLAALQTLQAASFQVISFESCATDYLDALRSVMEDPDEELRQRVLGVLARKEDPLTQEKLIAGLRDEKRALVPAAKALQLLASDIHTEAYDVARQVLESSPDPAAKRQAIRVLASDAQSAPLLEKILLDKNQHRDVRQVSAAALNTISPERLQKHARAIIEDESDYPEIQATSLTALNQFAPEAVTQDEGLRQRVENLATAKSEVLRRSAKAYLDRRSK